MVDDIAKPKEPAAHSVPAQKTLKKVRDYWPQARRRSIIVTISMELILAVVVTVALSVAGVSLGSTELSLIVFTIAVASIGVNLVLMHILIEPLKDISAALTHVSGEPNDIIAPNSTSPARKYDGLEPLLELIYGLSSHQDTSHETTASAQDDILSRGLNQAKGGFIICGEDGEIRYASRHAPVKSMGDTGSELSLIFDADQ
ncbi:hypothetical protein EOL96_09245, partial [Candidatus Saccharibacteria bacterium]|nr:hypothetical protein [Candidatus Saccharibacteria bacterium]